MRRTLVEAGRFLFSSCVTLIKVLPCFGQTLFQFFPRKKRKKKFKKKRKKKSQRGRTKTEISSRHSCTAEHAARGRRRLRTPTAPHIDDDDDDDDEKEDEDDDDRENTDDATSVFVGKFFSSSSTGWRERSEDCPLRDGVRVVLFVRDERRRRRKTNGAVFYDDDAVVVARRDENANVRARQAVGLCIFFERRV